MVTALRYSQIPEVSAWRHDSSVPLTRRRSDVVLHRIDTLLEAGHAATDSGQEMYLACELFFALDYWLRHQTRTYVMNRRRRPAVHALYECIANALCTVFTCTVNTLPRELEDRFGRQLTDHGVMLDSEWSCANYLSRADAKKYRLSFSKGLAYQLPWWDGKTNYRSWNLKKADSKHAKGTHVGHDQWGYSFTQSDVFTGEYGGFAMSVGRDIFMAPHLCDENQFGRSANFYHSSYLAGETIQCAGSMLIEQGVIRRIRNDSGHYKPSDQHLLNVLETLTMHGVPLTPIQVELCQLGVTIPAETFMSNRGNWNTILQRQVINWTYRRADLEKKKEDKELYECSLRLDKAGFPEDAAIAFVACYWKWTKVVAKKRLGEAKSRHEGAKEVREDRAKRLAGVGP